MTTRPATPLPWKGNDHSQDEGCFYVEAPGAGVAVVIGTDEQARRDAAYIVHAANAYPGLIGEVKLLRAALQKVRHFTIGEGAPTGNDSEQAAYVRRINGCEYAARDALERESLLRSLGEEV